MLTFAEIYGSVSDNIQKTDSTFQSKIKRWVNNNYTTVAIRWPWKALIDYAETGVTFTAGQAYMMLPKRVDRILMLSERTNNVVLSGVGVSQFWRRFTDVANNQASPISFTYAGEQGSILALTAASTVNVVSSSTSDNTAFTVRVQGTVSGEQTSETLTLNGTTVVTSSNTYDSGSFIRVSKSGTTTGTLTFKQTSNSNVLATLGQTEFTTSYRRIRLYQVPTAGTLAIYYVRSVERMVNDLDVPEWDCTSHLIAAASADGLREQRRFADAAQQEAIAEQEYMHMIQLEKQDDEIDQLMPYIDQTSGNRNYSYAWPWTY